MTAIPDHDEGLGEALITTREAVWRFNLPEYWLSHPKERRRRGIPHYRVGKLLRFKVSELEGWLCAQAQRDDTDVRSCAMGGMP